jgi:hypothetical protein
MVPGSMDDWSSLPRIGWLFIALVFGYAVGLIHGFWQHWIKGKVYCPRCLYYLNWRDTVLRDVVPKWVAKSKDPWEREPQKQISN